MVAPLAEPLVARCGLGVTVTRSPPPQTIKRYSSSLRLKQCVPTVCVPTVCVPRSADSAARRSRAARGAHPRRGPLGEGSLALSPGLSPSAGATRSLLLSPFFPAKLPSRADRGETPGFRQHNCTINNTYEYVVFVRLSFNLHHATVSPRNLRDARRFDSKVSKVEELASSESSGQSLNDVVTMSDIECPANQ